MHKRGQSILREVEDRTQAMERELLSYSSHFNRRLVGVDMVKHLLPISTSDPYDLIDKLKDGLLIPALIMQNINPQKEKLNLYSETKKLNPYQILENQDIVLEVAKRTGIKLINLHPEDLIEGRKNPHLLLGILWQLVLLDLIAGTFTQVRKDSPAAAKPENALHQAHSEVAHVLNKFMKERCEAPEDAHISDTLTNGIKDGRVLRVALHYLRTKMPMNSLERVELDEQFPEVLLDLAIADARALGVDAPIDSYEIITGNEQMAFPFIMGIAELVIKSEEEAEKARVLAEIEQAAREKERAAELAKQEADTKKKEAQKMKEREEQEAIEMQRKIQEAKDKALKIGQEGKPKVWGTAVWVGLTAMVIAILGLFATYVILFTNEPQAPPEPISVAEDVHVIVGEAAGMAANTANDLMDSANDIASDLLGSAADTAGILGSSSLGLLFILSLAVVFGALMHQTRHIDWGFTELRSGKKYTKAPVHTQRKTQRKSRR